jgi:hypothetical protein
MKLTLSSHEGECSVDFEPLGEFLALRGEDTLYVEFPGGEPQDIQIRYKGNGISIWPDYDWIRVTNRAGQIVLERDYRRRPG